MFLPYLLANQGPPPLPFVSPMFTDHMVIQRDRPNRIWGWGKKGEKVTVSVGGKSATAIAGDDGKWQATFQPPQVGGPYTLRVVGSQTVEFRDVLVGDVWFCSGQSNMEMGLAAVGNGEAEVKAADYPQIRLYSVPKVISAVPLAVNGSRWQVCRPATVSAGGWGGFSAVGYFFGRHLHRELQVPIGLIQSAWGGTIAEAWASRDGLGPLPEFLPTLQSLGETMGANRRSYQERVRAWYAANDPLEKQNLSAAKSLAGWKACSRPHFDAVGLSAWDGMVYFATTFRLDAVPEGATIDLGPVDDADTVWINGTLVGQTFQYDLHRRYSVPASALKQGENLVVIRVLDTTGPGGLTGDPAAFALRSGDKVLARLSGGWHYQQGRSLEGLPPFPQSVENNPNIPTVLHNGMVAPVAPFAIRGAIWYQGESNGNRGEQYGRLLPALIADWRKVWGMGDFPFYIVQLAPWQKRVFEPRENEWAELREAQLQTSLRVKNSGLAVTTDLGDPDDIHPLNKLDVGLRLAYIALAKEYGRADIRYSGPLYTGFKVQGDTLRLSFEHAEGLRGDLSGFAIAGADRKFVWASARIQGNEVWLSSPLVRQPVAARYAWDINPAAGLSNAAGLPASPFRTDSWPLISQGKR